MNVTGIGYVGLVQAAVLVDDVICVDVDETRVENLKKGIILIVTEWQQCCAPDFTFIKQSLNQAVIFDGRNLFEPERLTKQDITYYSIGRS